MGCSQLCLPDSPHFFSVHPPPGFPFPHLCLFRSCLLAQDLVLILRRGNARIVTYALSLIYTKHICRGVEAFSRLLSSLQEIRIGSYRNIRWHCWNVNTVTRGLWLCQEIANHDLWTQHLDLQPLGFLNSQRFTVLQMCIVIMAP